MLFLKSISKRGGGVKWEVDEHKHQKRWMVQHFRVNKIYHATLKWLPTVLLYISFTSDKFIRTVCNVFLRLKQIRKNYCKSTLTDQWKHDRRRTVESYKEPPESYIYLNHIYTWIMPTSLAPSPIANVTDCLTWDFTRRTTWDFCNGDTLHK